MLHNAVSDLASRARRYPLVRFCKSQRCRLSQKLVGQHPKPFNNFCEIGYAPLVLNTEIFKYLYPHSYPFLDFHKCLPAPFCEDKH